MFPEFLIYFNPTWRHRGAIGDSEWIQNDFRIVSYSLGSTPPSPRASCRWWWHARTPPTNCGTPSAPSSAIRKLNPSTSAPRSAICPKGHDRKGEGGTWQSSTREWFRELSGQLENFQEIRDIMPTPSRVRWTREKRQGEMRTTANGAELQFAEGTMARCLLLLQTPRNAIHE